ncbi:MAG: lycopene cyclase family protein [Sediminibacterium sp.]
MPDHYHYIITGAGCAGSSLLMRMMREPFFADKKILVIDQFPKTANDRTWCFWEKQAGIFEPIVYHQWNQLNFFSKSYSETLVIDPYQYKMIRGIDLYTYVKETSIKYSNIEWRYEKIKAIRSDHEKAFVELETETLTGDYIFNSILFNKLEKTITGASNDLIGGRIKKNEYLLLQHFKGWLIQTKEPAFNPSQATFMDFRVSQEHGTTFIYLMPITTTSALVEYTLFTEMVLQTTTYETALRNYISSYLQIRDYEIVHEEFGIIPMTNHQFPLQEERIIYMGIAGGQAKGSSGYAFQFIQKRTEKIVQLFVTNKRPVDKRSFNDRKFHLYDSVLLNVLHNRKMNGDEIFARIFQKNPVERVLQFLDNESSLMDDLKIMKSVPSSIFLPAAFKELFT